MPQPFEQRFPWNLDWNLLRTFVVVVEQHGISKFNQAGDQIDQWTRSDNPDASLSDVLSANPGALSKATIVEYPDSVVVAAPLPPGKDGVSIGQITTVWTTADIAASARDFALKAMASQIVVLVLSVGMLLFAMRRFVGRPLAEVNSRIVELQAGDIDSEIPHSDSQKMDASSWAVQG